MKEQLADLIRSGYVRQSICNSDGVPVTSYDIPLVEEDHVDLLAEYLLEYGVTMPQWIPVTERLPIEEYEEYKEKWQDDEYPGFLVMIEGALLPTHLYFDGEKWYETFGGGKYDHQVTHWMSLPAPPAKE